MFIVVVYDTSHVSHTAISYLHCVAVDEFVQRFIFRKVLSISFKNYFPRCIFSDILYDGLYQITVLFLLLDLLGSVVLSNFSLVTYPLVASAFSYSTLFSLNI